MTKNSKDFTQKELLIRIDERQKQMSKDIRELKKKICDKVPNDDDYKSMKQRVDELWDWKNKAIGIAAASGAAASLVFSFVENFL